LTTKAAAKKEFDTKRGVLWLFMGLLVAPVSFLLHLQINYALVPAVCGGARGRLVLHAVTILFILMAAGGALVSRRNWRAAGEAEPGKAASVLERSRLLSVVGLMLSGLVLLVLVAQWLPQFFINPCQR
jgi:uncharacterized membrane protein